MTFALWAGRILSATGRFVIVAPPGRERETILRLARIGYDNVVGYLAGGIEAWEKSGRQLTRARAVEPQDFKALYEKEHASIFILDVRNPGEKS
jgi:rhodanese-related sulfurtransferase